MEEVLDGFWLPAGLREEFLGKATWETNWLRGGQLSDEAVPGVLGGVRQRQRPRARVF